MLITKHLRIIGWTNVLLISVAAVLVSPAHGFLIRRMTFALFRSGLFAAPFL